MAGVATYTIAGRQIGGHYVCLAGEEKSRTLSSSGSSSLT